MPIKSDDHKMAKHFLEEEIKIKMLELAEYYDHNIVRFIGHVHKLKKSVKLDINLIDISENNS